MFPKTKLAAPAIFLAAARFVNLFRLSPQRTALAKLGTPRFKGRRISSSAPFEDRRRLV
jgi:hypothetical protein